MIFRKLLLASVSLAYLGCLGNDACDSSSNPDYWKPLTANQLNGCWDKIIQYPDHLRDTVSSFCYGDSTQSSFWPSQSVRQFTCKSFKLAGNTMSFDSLRIERYDSVNGAWGLTSMYKSLPGSTSQENWAISMDTLIQYQVDFNPNSCGTSMDFEYKYVRHSGRIDSTGIRHCDSLGYR